MELSIVRQWRQFSEQAAQDPLATTYPSSQLLQLVSDIQVKQCIEHGLQYPR